MKISVAIPTFNEESSIHKTLKSLLSQTLKPCEIIIADGGSTDNTLKAIEQFDSREIPIIVVDNSEKLCGTGRNIAVLHAKNDMIAFIDSDNIAAKNWLEELSRPFDSDSSVEVVFGRFFPNPETQFERIIDAVVFPGFADTDTEIRTVKDTGDMNTPCCSCMLIKKTVFEKIGGFPGWLRTSEDKLFFKKLLKSNSNIKYNPKAVIHHPTRKSTSALFRQYFSYGTGSACSAIPSKEIGSLMIKFFLGMVLLALSIWNPLFVLIVFMGIGRRVYRWGYSVVLKRDKNYFAGLGILWIPIILLTRDIALVLGHLAGYGLYLTNRRYRDKLNEYLHQ